ncbi:unnamed protein product [Ectocarpus sp. 6 AP-2014]
MTEWGVGPEPCPWDQLNNTFFHFSRARDVCIFPRQRWDRSPNFQRTRCATTQVQETGPPNFMLKPRNNLNREQRHQLSAIAFYEHGEVENCVHRVRLNPEPH